MVSIIDWVNDDCAKLLCEQGNFLKMSKKLISGYLAKLVRTIL
ncbi:hypothetical protein Nizo1840_1697 [Lactiplantibacillus plantarum]|nr:hypothetical protein SF2A35B_2108 [Lactiplantibacillus plantarum]KZT81581.1 hypothetical protein Nizo1839_1379 [Lactiplantibacillus plantarum]KZT82810.1 hypothetical protein Nizo1840_1697 [Lactiplantibacillus plantarum]KZU14782.1 hypothetical protein Nizo2264_0978 [Lactiplantibacillus plantarum]